MKDGSNAMVRKPRSAIVWAYRPLGWEIKDIKRFMDWWCAEGPSTYKRRKALFEQQRRKVDEQIARLEKTRAMIDFKCWYYGQACELGTEDFSAMIPDSLPDDVKAQYELAHR